MRDNIIAHWKAWFLTQIQGLRRSQAKTLLDLVIGLIRAERLGVASIGRGMSGPVAPKHRIKRVDRFLGNPRLNREAAAQDAIRFIVMGRRWVPVILDWTDCHDGHQTLVAALVSRQGRAVPVFTQTVAKADLTLRQGAIERRFIQRLRPLFPPTCTPVLLADRGFCSASFLAAAHAAGWKWIIRLKGDRWIETPDYHGRLDEYATTRTRWGDWPAIRIGKAARQVWRLVATWAEGQQEPWFLVTNCGHLTADQIIRAYARRFQIEELFKDSKNGERGGFRLRGVRLTRADRWDRLWLIFTWAYVWLVLLWLWAEATGIARRFQANTVRQRTHACWKVGRYVWTDELPPPNVVQPYHPLLLLWDP